MAPRKPGTGGNRFTEQRKEVYLNELRRTGIKKQARIVANVSPSCVERHRKRHPEFQQAELDSLVSYCQKIEEEINRRAIEGVSRPVYQGGKQVGSIREYSDALLIRLAKRHIPSYRDSIKVDQDTNHSGAVALGLADLSKLPREGRDLLRRLLQCEIPDDEDDGTEEEEADEG